MEQSMSHLFPHKPKDYHAYWTIESLSEFTARASFGSYENFNHDSILKRKQNQEPSKQRNSNKNNREAALDLSSS